MFPSLSILKIPDFFPVPINVPIVSNKSEITNVNIVIITTTIPALALSNPPKSSFRKVGSIDGISLYSAKFGNCVTPNANPTIVVRIIDFI